MPIAYLVFASLPACLDSEAPARGGPDAGGGSEGELPGDNPGDPGVEEPDAGVGAEDGGDGDGDVLPDDPEENLVVNPGFEAGDVGPGCPASWECVTYNPSDAGAFSTSDDARSGEKAASWTGDGEPAVVIKQPHASSPGRQYRIAAWYKTENTTEPPYAQILFHDASGAELDWEIVEGDADADDWQRLVSEPVTAPANTARVQLNLSLNGTGGTVWWDDAVLLDVSEGDGDLPPAEYEVIEAQGQTIQIGAGETFENKLIDFRTGQGITIVAHSTNWTIRNIGFLGQRQAPGTTFGLSDQGGGASVFENIYMGDGSTRAGGQPTCPNTDCTHGPTGIWISPQHSGHIDIRRVNVQGWPDNGIYGSAPGTNANGQRGSIHIDSSYGANNYVSTFRLAGANDRLTNSVSFNSSDGYNGRPVWIWPSGPVTIRNVELGGGAYGPALIAGANGNPSVVNIENSQVSGPLRADHGSTINESNVGSNPTFDMPAGVPQGAEEAASGRAGH